MTDGRGERDDVPGGVLVATIDLSLRYRGLVVGAGVLLIAVGAWSVRELPLDAFPDTTPVQVQVNTTAPSLGSEEVEQQITVPLETAIRGLPGLEEIRSISKFGLSQVTATFEDGFDVYFARQLIHEKIEGARLPAGLATPRLGPVATGLGEIYHYIVERQAPPGVSEAENLAYLRTLQDWVLKPQLASVPGVAEVNSWGGFEKRYEVRVDPVLLAKHGLTLDAIAGALRRNNLNVGGGMLAGGGEAQVVKGVGIVTSAGEIGAIVLASVEGAPVRVRDVAEVAIGHEIRRAAATEGGRGEVVLGLGFMLTGENSRDVTRNLDARMAEAQRTLPEGVTARPVYERTHLVDRVLATVRQNLFEGALLVIAVLFAFLGDLRAGLIVASAIPLSLLFAGNCMLRFGIAGSLLSLGAIDFGLIVDSSVVMVENCSRRLAESDPSRTRFQVLRDAALEVRRPTLFGELIIMIVYLPILTLGGVEGKLFRPMALTLIFALAGSLVLSLTLVPALASYGLSRRPRRRETLADRWAHAIFQPVLSLGLRHPRKVLGIAAALTLGTAIMGLRLGTEFIPRLDEGSIVINTVRLSGVSLEESLRYGNRIEDLLLAEFPDEIARIWTRTGTPEVATDPMGIELSDVFIMLTPRDRWKRVRNREDLVAEIARTVEDLPGMRSILTQPIEMRVNEMLAGIRGDVGIKVFGEDLDALREKAREIQEVLEGIEGAADVLTEQVTGQPVLEATPDAAALARHGVSREEVLAYIEAVGGIPAGEVREAQRRFPLVVRLADRYLESPEALGEALFTTRDGKRIPLAELLRLERREGPATITREWGRRRILVQLNVRGRDVGSFIEEARSRIEPLIEYPFTIGWGGQHENYEKARVRLWLAVPLALALILGLLYVSLGSWRDALMVSTGVLFARIGGILGLWIRGMPFSISAAVGFVALAGAAMLEGLILVSYIRRMMDRGMSKRAAIEEARLVRLRPVLMTGLVAALGFVPMAFSTGVGAEVQRPLATVIVFGMATDTVLTLLVLPAMYLLFGKENSSAPESSRKEP